MNLRNFSINKFATYKLSKLTVVAKKKFALCTNVFA